MRGVFRLVDTIGSVTTAKTLLYITSPSNAVVEILGAKVTCQNEDTSEQIMIELNRISSLGTPTATTIVPKVSEEGASAFGGVCKSNVTAGEPTYDDESAAMASGGANKLAGFDYSPLPEERPILSPNDSVGLRLLNTIDNSCDLTAELLFREIGG